MLSLGPIFGHEVSLSLKALAITNELPYLSSRMSHAEVVDFLIYWNVLPAYQRLERHVPCTLVGLQ